MATSCERPKRGTAPPDSILVLGGTGKVGKRIADQLACKAIPTLAASRSGKAPPSSASSEYLQGVKFDWFDETTWENPWKAASPHNVTAVHIIAPPILDSFPVMAAFVNFALSKGSRRFVLQSASAVEAGDEWAMGRLHAYVRRLGNEGKADWAVLRPTWFMENFSEVESHIRSIKEERRIYSATDFGLLPFVSADDVAACAVKLLTQEEPPHTEYTILGPNNLNYDKVAQIISEVLGGKKVKHVNISYKQLEERLQSFGIPEDYAKALSGLDRRISLNKEHRYNENVQTLLGRKPIDFTTFAQAVKHVWE